jgi:hypothetical protein
VFKDFLAKGVDEGELVGVHGDADVVFGDEGADLF